MVAVKLSKSQEDLLKSAIRKAMKEFEREVQAASRHNEPSPSIYNVRVLGITPKKAAIFIRLGLLEHRGNDRDEERVRKYNYGRTIFRDTVPGEPRLYWTRAGLEAVQALLITAKTKRKNPMAKAYTLKLYKNGAQCGEFGPYARKSDADKDARALKAKMGAGASARVRANSTRRRNG